jgi:hypothetical protein
MGNNFVQDKLTIVTGLCLIALIVILKNVVLVPADALTRDVIIYIIIYTGFSMTAPKKINLLHSTIAIVLITAAIIGVNALL